MYWINFLHIYQPIDQSKEILKRVVNESYRPLFKGLLRIPKIKLTLNISAALTQLLAREGYGDVLKAIRELAENNKLEFTESAKYHALLPFLEPEEIKRQIIGNHKVNKKYFGKAYRPICFFPPEMAYNQSVGLVVSALGYPMIILDEISYNGGKETPPFSQLFAARETKGLIIVFRERRISNCVMSAIIRSKKEFLDLIKDDLKENRYICTAMDGETFGHHRLGLEQSLFEILSDSAPKQIFISEVPKYFSVKSEITPVSATWASSQEDIEKGIQFYSWQDPRNKVHKLQWEFLRYLDRLSHQKSISAPLYDKMDNAFASDQFFWASGEPWWSIEMIEKGAWTTLRTLRKFPDLTDTEMKIGEDYYKNILATAFWWQRSGKIEEKARKYREAVKIPFKERTLESDKPEVYYTFLNVMREKMRLAAKNGNFEKAILWRDAVWKLETKNDIYDAVHAVDLLRLEMPDLILKKMMDSYKKKYNKIKSGQPEARKI